jgi:hypothetical protein
MRRVGLSYHFGHSIRQLKTEGNRRVAHVDLELLALPLENWRFIVVK